MSRGSMELEMTNTIAVTIAECHQIEVRMGANTSVLPFEIYMDWARHVIVALEKLTVNED